MTVYFKAVETDTVLAFSDTDAAGMRSHPRYTEVNIEDYEKYQESLDEAIQKKPLKKLKKAVPSKKAVNTPAKRLPAPSRTVKPKALDGKPSKAQE